MIDEKARNFLQTEKSKSVASLLKKMFPDVKAIDKSNEKMASILIPCLLNQNPQVVKVVLDYFQLDPDMVLKGKNLRPLHVAASYGSFEAISDLIRAGANPYLKVDSLTSEASADFMEILNAQRNMIVLAKAKALLKELKITKPEGVSFQAEDSDFTEEGKIANTGGSSSASALLVRRK